MKLSGKPRRKDRCGEEKNGVHKEFELAGHANGQRALLCSAQAGGGRSGSLSRVLYVVPGRIQSLIKITESIQMKLSKSSLQLALAVGMVLGAPAAFAATGTLAGTTISNTATVNFSVGGVAQTAQNSNTSTFLVDRSVNLSVIETDASIIQVVPGQPQAVTTFKVTNNSNSTQDFSLAALNAASGVTVLGGTDNTDFTSLTVFVESGATAGYQSGADTATFIDELAPGASATVYVLANVPAGATNGQVAAVALTATASQSVDANGQYVATVGTLASPDVATSGADTQTKVDTVFADAAGATDAANDGKSSAYDAYKVVTATIAVVKTSTVISDPVNGTTNPKALPGAVIEYCLAVTNSGAVAATGVTLTDAIPTNTTYVASTIKVNSTAGSGGATTCAAGTGTAVADTGGDPNGGFASNNVTAVGGSVAAGATFRAVFRVTVN